MTDLSNIPECACPVITEFAIVVSNMLRAKERQKLNPFIFRLMGSRDPDSERARAEYLAWQAITVFAPLYLDSVGLSKEASRLRNFDKSLGLKKASIAAAGSANAVEPSMNAADMAA